jgi:hypothetical protein
VPGVLTFAANPSLIERSNELTRRSENADRRDYDAAKREFFNDNF